MGKMTQKDRLRGSGKSKQRRTENFMGIFYGLFCQCSSALWQHKLAALEAAKEASKRIIKGSADEENYRLLMAISDFRTYELHDWRCKNRNKGGF